MANRNITKLELLLAISMSEYYQKLHVHFIPPQTNYTDMLQVLRSSGYISNLGATGYTCTDKGRKYLIRKNASEFIKADAIIDEFIDSL